MVLTDDECKDVFYDENKAYKYAEVMGGEAVCVYYYPFDEYVLGIPETDGDFLGWVVERDGKYYTEEECIEEVGELDGY